MSPAAIEYGHDNAAAIPFMRTAAHREKNKTIQNFGRLMKEGIEAAT